MKTKPKLPKVALLRELFNFNMQTGDLIYRVGRQRCAVGAVAGNSRNDGHKFTRVRIDGNSYMGHDLAWMMVWNKPIPEGYAVMHLSDDTRNNRPDNLCLVRLPEFATAPVKKNVDVVKQVKQVVTNTAVLDLLNSVNDIPKAEPKLNARNTSGIKGVYFDAAKGKYRAEIIHEGKKHRLGSFDDLFFAHKALYVFKLANGITE